MKWQLMKWQEFVERVNKLLEMKGHPNPEILYIDIDHPYSLNGIPDFIVDVQDNGLTIS